MSDAHAESLLPSQRMREQALEGEITQIHRGQAYAEEGDQFDIDGTTFEVVDVTDRSLGDMTDEDARKEGARDLEQYKEMLRRSHEEFEWDDDSPIVRHRFEQV